jgi:hypothetical protein
MPPDLRHGLPMISLVNFRDSLRNSDLFLAAGAAGAVYFFSGIFTPVLTASN